MEGTYAFHGYCLFAIGHVNRNYRNNSLRQFMIFFSYRFYIPSCGRENTGIVKHKSRQAKLRIEYQIGTYHLQQTTEIGKSDGRLRKCH